MIKDEKTGLLRDMTEEEVNITEFFDAVKFDKGISAEDMEYIENLRKEDPIVDSYISALEFELKELIK